MNNELVVEKRSTAIEIRAQVNLIQEVMKAVMQEGTHYGTIPGCKKPSLYKPGSEIILSTFRLACDPVVEDLSTEDEAKFRVSARLTHMGTGVFVGAGIGECSSNELKYKWRKPVCEGEFENTPEDRKREKWQSGFGGKDPKQVKQVRTEIADVANTILKMAKKRAQVDATLTATAASDIFTQDIEDIPAEILGNNVNDKPVTTKPDVEPPTSKSETNGGRVISEAQAKRFYAIARGTGRNNEEIKNWLTRSYNLGSSRDIPASIYDEICTKITIKDE